MPMSLVSSVLGGVLLLLAVITYLIIRGGKGGREETLYDRYQKALRAGGKRAALRAGRIYYSCIGRGPLSATSKEAIKNDLRKMDDDKV